MAEYIVQKVLSNNIVKCQKIGEDEDCIVQGKGIGFQRKRGDVLPQDMIEKIYFKRDEKKINQYLDLVEKCDEVLVDAVEEIIRRMEVRFGNVYDEYVHIALLDHLNFSLYRYRNHIEINNIFLDEYRLMYAEEYAFAKEMVVYINEQLHVQLPESETGFITLHFHSALHKESVSKSALYMQIIASCIALVEDHLQMQLDHGSIERMRLITHLKFALERADQKVELANPVLDSLKVQYPQTYEIALALSHMMQEQYGVCLPEGELGYLMLHIQNIVMTLKPKGE